MGVNTLAPTVGLARRWPRITHAPVLQAWQAVAAIGLAVFVLHVTVGIGGPGAARFFDRWLYSALLVLAAGGILARVLVVRAERGAWIFLAVGLTSWVIGDIYYTFVFGADPDPPFPSIADGFYLAFYPAAYIALVQLVRGRVREFPRAVWWDGLIATLAAASLGATVLVEPVLRATKGTFAVVVTNLAYPIGDTLLLALTLGVFALTGWRPGKHWAFIGAALIASAVADGLFLFQIAEGTYREGSYMDALWPTSMLLLALAAWNRPGQPKAIQLEGARLLVAPAVCSFLPIGVLLYAYFDQVHPFAVVTATLTLFGVMIRAGLTFRENQDMLGRISQLAVTDALTGLGNRRRLLVDLEEALETEPPALRMLAIFDLDGFKTYNDRFGHPAGDVLLARLAGKLAAATNGRAAAYRLGGDEFCVLGAAGEEDVDELLRRASTALSEYGEGFAVTASHGTVLIPLEARHAPQALAIADRRLYERKRSLRADGRQSLEVLLQALRERRPELHERARTVARLAREVGLRLGLTGPALDQVRAAAEVQDIGLIAVPDDVLQKSARLDDAEQDFIRGHVEVGERILRAASTLTPLASVVRATHERWDGQGSPDGLAGDAIPLAARIVAACAALVALTSDRPYRGALPIEDALAELRRNAGTQFDPLVVAAVEDVAGVAAWRLDVRFRRAG